MLLNIIANRDVDLLAVDLGKDLDTYIRISTFVTQNYGLPQSLPQLCS